MCVLFLIQVQYLLDYISLVIGCCRSSCCFNCQRSFKKQKERTEQAKNNKQSKQASLKNGFRS